MIIKTLDYLRLLVQFHKQELKALDDSESWGRPYGCIGAIIAYVISSSVPTSIDQLTKSFVSLPAVRPAELYLTRSLAQEQPV
jgi:hypothetical protein